MNRTEILEQIDSAMEQWSAAIGRCTVAVLGGDKVFMIKAVIRERAERKRLVKLLGQLTCKPVKATRKAS